MAKVPMPPGGILRRKDHVVKKTICVPYEDLSIAFKHNGVLFPIDGDNFKPDLPPGLFFNGTEIGPFKPVQNNTDVLVGFFSITRKTLYLVTVQFRSRCPE